MKWLFISTSLLLVNNVFASDFPTSARAQESIKEVEDTLILELEEKNLRYGSPIFIRIFKELSALELWVQSENGTFKLFKSYEICSFSGDLGPKVKEGDRQSPEGFYFVTAGRLNPWSSFHLSFNLGYPNAFDRAHNRTGSALMIHGDCVSIGCYAMTNKYINEIYALAVAALKNGQPFFRVHAFPFKLEQSKLNQYKNHQWFDFWQNLQEGYNYFETHQKPPNVTVQHGKYVFGP